MLCTLSAHICSHDLANDTTLCLDCPQCAHTESVGTDGPHSCEQSAARTLEYPESSADQCVRSYMDLKEKAAGNIVDGWNFPKVGSFSRLGPLPLSPSPT
jgi:hypothetical protein